MIPSRLRVLPALLLALLAGAFVLARPDGKPRKEEEDDPPAKKEVEEAPPKPGKSRVLDIDDEPKEKAPKPAGDLAELARTERDAQTKALYERLAVPADVLTLRLDVEKNIIKTLRVKPMSRFIADPRALKEPITVRPLATPGKERKVSNHAVRKVRYYEQVAADEAEKFMDRAEEPRYAKLVAAEQALSAAIRFHQSAAQRGIREGAEWNPLEERLRKLLVRALLGQMDSLVESKAWKAAFDLTARLAEAAPRASGPENAEVVGKVASFLRKALNDPSFASMEEIRRRMQQLEDLFPGAGVGKPLRDELRRRAAGLMEQAKQFAEKGDNPKAIDLLRQAEKTWPDLPGLRECQTGIDRTYQMLRVGGRGLPEPRWPAQSSTESERRVEDLLFEGLVQLVPDKEGRLYYRPQLAQSRPQVLALGRRFVLPPEAKWSDGTRLSAGAVRSTVKWMKGDARASRTQVWGDLLADAEMAGVSHKVGLRLKQGFLDPMALMTFKILPPRMAGKPFGSGPFAYAGDGTDPVGGAYKSYKANPHYGARDGKRGLPRLSEVRMYSPADPAKALASGQVDLALDLTGEEAGTLAKLGYQIRKPDAVNRRIWFLAVNNKAEGLEHAEMRLALARAVPRQKILDGVFRKGLGMKAHAALNGPYPVGSWACDPALAAPEGKPSADPHDPDLAKAKFKEALAKAKRKEIAFTILYPQGDKQAAEAMGELCAQAMQTLPGLELKAEAVRPEELRQKTEKGDYQLAYCHYDFPEGAFWLGPLLSAGPSGENFLNYGGPLQAKADAAMKVRHFPEVRKRARDIHRQLLLTEMPFIPLWQLDPLLAMRKKGLIEHPPFEAIRPFARIAEWSVKRGG